MKKKFIVISIVLAIIAKIALIIFVVPLIFLIVLFISLFITIPKTDSDITNYLKHNSPIDSYSREVMPDLEYLPEHQDKEYRYHHKMGAFPSESVVLVVKYDDKIYESEKAKLNEKYVFSEEKVNKNQDEDELLAENEFSINTYKFKVVGEDTDLSTSDVKSFGMIGMSDEENSIAYLYYYDSELDYISDNLDEFVDHYFDYDF